MSKFEYKTVYTNTTAGLEQAEALHVAGWKTIRVGLFLIQFEREVPTPDKKSYAEVFCETYGGKPEKSTDDQSELFDISLSVALLTDAWGKGDERAIQNAMDLIIDWQKRRQDRLAEKKCTGCGPDYQCLNCASRDPHAQGMAALREENKDRPERCRTCGAMSWSKESV